MQKNGQYGYHKVSSQTFGLASSLVLFSIGVLISPIRSSQKEETHGIKMGIADSVITNIESR